MKAQQIANMSEKDIESKFAELQKELVKLRAQNATGSAPQNNQQIKNIKRLIARILTQNNKTRKQTKI
ncbi:50S ribosomal protein L29 [Candidatus Woesearchaeota archaeon]|nr:50S ribosomal protein L29 [Candidatus Woesearchaeota archaeon]